ncbi:RDD family protein [Candidatus Peregrinibacteria bacterium]|nr:RDD family protein [Candidatus Peregrinibacteria bacterium]MBI3816542.1 RDD family protein [Candidatus Peregrinibacteria bacterium]
MEPEMLPRGGSLSSDPYAGFWLRVGASSIDGILVQIVVLLIGIATGQLQDWLTPSGVSSGANLWVFLVSLVYFTAMESSSAQATVGKMLLHIAVTDLSGRQISVWRAATRQLGKILSGLVLGIGFLMAGFTQKKQALHDMLARTLVVRA